MTRKDVPHIIYTILIAVSVVFLASAVDSLPLSHGTKENLMTGFGLLGMAMVSLPFAIKNR